jgi:hypothetical protein
VWSQDLDFDVEQEVHWGAITDNYVYIRYVVIRYWLYSSQPWLLGGAFQYSDGHGNYGTRTDDNETHYIPDASGFAGETTYDINQGFDISNGGGVEVIKWTGCSSFSYDVAYNRSGVGGGGCGSPDLAGDDAGSSPARSEVVGRDGPVC